jgi:hypothetical protein
MEMLRAPSQNKILNDLNSKNYLEDMMRGGEFTSAGSTDLNSESGP